MKNIFILRKKGFTLIEIIICISLVVILWTVSFFGIRLIKRNITIKELIQVEDIIYEVANVYLETRTEAKHQLYQENNAVIIPLNVLKNEGLLKLDDINTDDHYVLSLLGSETSSQACEDITTVASWQVNNDKTIYLCTSKETESKISEILARINTIESNYVKIDDYNLKISDIESRLNDLENNTGDVILKLTGEDGEYIARGKNPNNYVIFDVGAEWSSSDTDLFRILSIYNNKIKIVYNKTLTGWTFEEAIENKYNTSNSKKKSLYDDIVNKDYLFYDYYKYQYSCRGYASSGSYSDYTCSLNYNAEGEQDYMGTITSYDIEKSIADNSTWLNESYLAGKNSNVPALGSILLNASYAFFTNPYNSSYTGNYLPVLALKTNVKLVVDTTCSSNKVVGSKDCPYKLTM